jgi:hypothetical protein
MADSNRIRKVHLGMRTGRFKGTAVILTIEIQTGRVGQKTAINGTCGRLHTVQKIRDSKFSHIFEYMLVRNHTRRDLGNKQA